MSHGVQRSASAKWAISIQTDRVYLVVWIVIFNAFFGGLLWFTLPSIWKARYPDPQAAPFTRQSAFRRTAGLVVLLEILVVVGILLTS